jgi:Mg-chelatase subunit ChlD
MYRQTQTTFPDYYTNHITDGIAGVNPSEQRHKLPKSAVVKVQPQLEKEDPPVAVATTKQKTIVGIALDRSSSMEKIRDTTISAFNEQIEGLLKTADEMDTTVTLVTFASTVDDVVIDNQDIRTLAPLTRETYKPDGNTAMLDALATLTERIEKIPGIDEPNTAVLILVVSDGQENNSRYHSWEVVGGKIKSLQEKGNWTFTYLGANQDMWDISRQLNIPISNTYAFCATNAGVSSASNYTSGRLNNYAEARLKGVRSFDAFFDPSDTSTTP